MSATNSDDSDSDLPLYTANDDILDMEEGYKSIILAKVAHNWKLLQNVAEEFRNDKDVVLAARTGTPSHLPRTI